MHRPVVGVCGWRVLLGCVVGVCGWRVWLACVVGVCGWRVVAVWLACVLAVWLACVVGVYGWRVLGVCGWRVWLLRACPIRTRGRCDTNPNPNPNPNTNPDAARLRLASAFSSLQPPSNHTPLVVTLPVYARSPRAPLPLGCGPPCPRAFSRHYASSAAPPNPNPNPNPNTTPSAHLPLGWGLLVRGLLPAVKFLHQLLSLVLLQLPILRHRRSKQGVGAVARARSAGSYRGEAEGSKQVPSWSPSVTWSSQRDAI